MQVVYRRCAGLDVHKDSITATILVFLDKGEREVRTQEFRTYWKDVQRLAKWLRSSLVECVATESTGVYWKPVWNVLEKTLKLVLANPYQIKNIPTQKTDRRDSVWIADLLAHGLIKPSFAPAPEIRQLRDLTRLRVQVTGEHTRVHNRIHKVLEDANIKLDTVRSFGHIVRECWRSQALGSFGRVRPMPKPLIKVLDGAAWDQDPFASRRLSNKEA